MKDYFKFKKLIKESDKPSRAKEGQFADDVSNSEEDSIKEAEKRSKKAGNPDYSVYQSRLDHKEFKTAVSTEQQDLEKWRLLGTAKNGNYSRVHSAEKRLSA